MNLFETNIPLTSSKRPVLVEGEIEFILQENVTIYEGEVKSKFEKGLATLTTHRLIWMDPAHKFPPMALAHSHISSVASASSGWNGSPKIQLTLTNGSILKLSFKAGGRDPFVSKYQICISNKAWEAKQQKKAEAFTTTKAGVSGIMKNIDNKNSQTDKTLQQAFSDVNALMAKAKDMVTIAEKLTGQANKEKEDSEVRNMLVSLGIASPVTKESAGSLYHSQLSRQLADWLPKPLAHFGGMLALTDVYCFFNRARGTEMISPEDLYRACVLFEELQLPVRLRKFDSGVLVVQSLSYSDEEIAKDIAAIVRRDGPQTAFDLAKTKNVSLPLANEFLLTAERMGVLCRDETVEGLVFYLNFFQDLNLLTLYIKS